MAIALERLRGGGVEVPINLLPTEIRADQRLRRVLNGVFGAAGLVLLILITLTVLQRMAVSHARSDLAEATAEATRLQGEVTALAPYGQMEQRLISTRQSLAAALLGNVAWTKFMTDLSTTIPGDSWVTNLTLNATPGNSSLDGSQTYGTATYAGNVTTFPGLAGWLQSMAKLKGLNFVYLSNGSKGTNGVVSFSASANITPSILSGRCQTETAPCP